VVAIEIVAVVVESPSPLYNCFVLLLLLCFGGGWNIKEPQLYPAAETVKIAAEEDVFGFMAGA
jgi:hypothetical protein